MGPWLKLAEHLGAFVGQLTEESIDEIEIVYNGVAKEMNLHALNAAAIAGVMKAANPGRQHGVRPRDGTRARGSSSAPRRRTRPAFSTAIFPPRGQDAAQGRGRSRARCSRTGKPRFIQIKGINIDAEIGAHMLYTTNKDVPGIIGTLGQTMGENGVNIANFHPWPVRAGRGRPSRCSISTNSRRPMCSTSSRPRACSSRCGRCSSRPPERGGYVRSHWTRSAR